MPTLTLLVLAFALTASEPGDSAPLVDKREQLERQSFWGNRDFDWYAEHIPY